MVSFIDGAVFAGTFRIGPTAVDYRTCPNGFTVLFQATRSNDNSLWAQCTVNVAVLQVRELLGQGKKKLLVRSDFLRSFSSH